MYPVGARAPPKKDMLARMTYNRKFVRASLIMVMVGLAMLLAIIASALLFVERTSASFDRLVEELAIRRSTADLFSLVQDAETGQRGYLLTGNTLFLEPYDEALEEIKKAKSDLLASASDRKGYEGQVAPLISMIDTKLDEMARTILLAKAGNLESALKIIQDGLGRKLMTSIRQGMQTILDISDVNIQSNIGTQIRSSAQLKWTILGAGIAIVIVLGGAIYVIMRHVQSITSARREMMRLNEELEDRVLERTEDLVRANQEIQRYAYIVTHDLRAPLVNIMGFTSELEMSLEQMKAYVLADGEQLSTQDIQDARTAATEEVPEALNFIRSSTSKMDGLINAILKISRDGRRQLKPERVDIRAVVENSSSSLQHLIDGADGTVEIKMPRISVNSDRLSIEQIFTNLMDNAIKYRNRERPLKVVVTAARKGTMLEAEISDNGRGIGPDDLERVFELFRRAGTQDQTGEGIGLAHVRSLARNLGGDISVRSTLGEGSTFVLRIPADLGQILRRV